MCAAFTNVYSPRRPPRRQRIALRGVEHHVSSWGDEQQPLVVYLHGWGDSGSTLQMVADHLTPARRWLAPDWRGFGRSAHAGTSYWFPDYLADLDALLAVVSPDSPVHLVGHSMGANVAGLYAGIKPERVATLVNIEGFGLSDSDADAAPERYGRWLTGVAEPAEYRTYASFSELAERLCQRHRHLDAAYAEFIAREWAAEGADGSVRLRADSRHRLPNPVLYRRAEAESCWRRITAEVAVVVGAESSFVAGAEPWVNNLSCKDVPIRSVAKAGHMLHFEAPEELAEVLNGVFT